MVLFGPRDLPPPVLDFAATAEGALGPLRPTPCISTAAGVPPVSLPGDSHLAGEPAPCWTPGALLLSLSNHSVELPLGATKGYTPGEVLRFGLGEIPRGPAAHLLA